ncbi:hypothetical protein KGQ64_13655, partial [bacterium]|nr:hypothetical protein [bacterium]
MTRTRLRPEQGRSPVSVVRVLFLVAGLSFLASPTAPAQAVPTATGMRAAQAALERETGARVTVDRGTGAARSMRFAAGR